MSYFNNQSKIIMQKGCFPHIGKHPFLIYNQHFGKVFPKPSGQMLPL